MDKSPLLRLYNGNFIASKSSLAEAQAAHAHYTNERDSCLRAVCYKRLFTKDCMGCKRFFLKVRKNVMFLNKIDIPYCCLPASPAVLKRFRRVSATLVFHTKIVVSLGRPWQKVTGSCDEINNI